MKLKRVTPRSRLGQKGEKEAEGFLKKHRYRIITRRYQCRYGEIDLIARQGKNLCFIEVKTRRDAHFGSPEEALTKAKIRKISLTAKEYIRKKKLEDHPVRFDVVTVRYENGEPVISLIKGAFESATGD
jgi:putative endonuclease